MRFDPAVPIEDAVTPPSSWYVAPEMHALEQQAVFGRCWHPVARDVDLGAPGAYASGCIAGEPWVAVHGSDGTVRAFSNVCRHKGREVVQGMGRAEKLVCGYHAWTYDLDGRLRSAPRMAGIRGFDREAMSLPSLRAERWGRWVFVNWRDDAPALRGDLPELDALLGERGWDRLRFVASRSWTLQCNWKVYVDNFLDGGYHVPHMHPSLDAQIDMASYRTEAFGLSSVQTVAAAAQPDARTAVDPGARIGAGAIYAWIYPNFMINRYGPCLDTNHVVPLGPDRCRVDYEFWFEDVDSSEARAFIDASVEQADITQHEDIAICESVQVGLRSRSYDVGRYAPRVEIGEHHFHRLLAADLRAAV
jgi:choline monooxygenase